MIADEVLQALKRLKNATKCSLAGVVFGVRTQPALRQEWLVLVLVIPAAWLLAKDGRDRVLLIGSWALVIVVEYLNSAVETVVDRIGKEHHELSGRAKDLASAAVCCTIVLAAGVWISILFSV
jgi:diacylglycerol kinase (ATP)